MCGLSCLNSGDARYLLNSLSHSAASRGGKEPVTGFHSVMLSLLVLARKRLQMAEHLPRLSEPSESSKHHDSKDACCAPKKPVSYNLTADCGEPRAVNPGLDYSAERG